MMFLTIRRGEDGRFLDRCYVGSRAVRWDTRTGTVRSFLGSPIDPWISGQLERGGDREEFLRRMITVVDECKY